MSDEEQTFVVHLTEAEIRHVCGVLRYAESVYLGERQDELANVVNSARMKMAPLLKAKGSSK